MVQLSVDSPRRRARPAGARNPLLAAGARLRRALRRNQDTERARRSENLERTFELESAMLEKDEEFHHAIRSLTAGEDDRRRATREKRAALLEEFRVLEDALGQILQEASSSPVDDTQEPQPVCTEAKLPAEIGSLREFLDRLMSELSGERNNVQRGSQAKEDLPAVLQRARASQTRADSLREELQWKLSVKKTIHLDDKTNLATILHQSTFNGVMPSFEKTEHTYQDNFVPDSSDFRGYWLSSTESTYSGSSDKSDNSDTTTKRIEFLLERVPDSLRIKGVVVKSNAVSWFAEFKK